MKMFGKAAIAAVLASLVPGLAEARSIWIVADEAVYDDPQTLRQLYGQMQRAAFASCTSEGPLTAEARAQRRACQDQAMDDAVARSGQPLLVRLHKAKLRQRFHKG